MSPKVPAALLLVTAMSLAGCSGGDDSSTTAPTVGAAKDGTVRNEATSSTSRGATDGTEPDTPADLAAIINIGRVMLDEVGETGPHPVLTWRPVSNARSYWLVVHDADGQPYWAWTGEGTSVRVGGGGSEEPNQTAQVYEPMTWQVAAFDRDGRLVATSELGTISP